MKTIKQSLTLLLSMVIVFLVTNTQLDTYLTEIVGFLILVTAIYMASRRNKNVSDLTSPLLFVFGITTGILLIIFLTGGISSNLFFLTYFLLFGISFLFEPPTVFVFLLGILAVFSNEALKNDVFGNMIRVGSLVLLSPLAYFFGKEYRKKEKLEEKIEKDSREIIENADSLLKTDGTNMNGKDVEKVSNILEKANDLKNEAAND